jgi:predicted nucleic acid-binding protein
MIVVDTNVLVYLLLPTPHAAQADAILLKDPDWIAPALIHSEFRNVLLGANAARTSKPTTPPCCWIGRWRSLPCLREGQTAGPCCRWH